MRYPSSRPDWGHIILALVLFIGLAFRLAQAHTESLWVDEAYSAAAVQLPFIKMCRVLAVDVHPPVYYFALFAWCKLFGYSPIALRMLSIILGFALLPLVYSMARRYGNQAFALSLTALLAVNDMHAYYSQEVRMYSLQILLLLAATWYLLKIEEKGHFTPKTLSIYVILSTLAIYTHYLSLFILAGHALYLLWNRPVKRRLLLIFIPVLLLFAPWALFVIPQQVASQQYCWLQTRSDLTLSQLRWTLCNLITGEVKPHNMEFMGWFFLLGLLPLFLLGAASAWHGRFSRWSRLALCCGPLMILAAFLISQVKMMWVPRFFTPTIPFLLLLLLLGVATIPNKKARAVVLSMLLLTGTCMSWQLRLEPRRPPWNQVYEMIRNSAGSNDLVVLHHSQLTNVWNYYMKQWPPEKLYVTRQLAPGHSWKEAAWNIRTLARGRQVWLVQFLHNRVDPREELIAELSSKAVWFEETRRIHLRGGETIRLLRFRF
jgi:mannosyltransferase